MKKPAIRPHILLLFLISLLVGQETVFSQEAKAEAEVHPYRGAYAVVGDQFAIWNGSSYVEIFLKGINMGVSVPGTQPGQLDASRLDYRRWFSLIREAGYNTLRLYTLHYPRFYEELRSFNLAHPREPLLVMQGIWLEENEGPRDLFEQSASFNKEIQEVVLAVHGGIGIDPRLGKAHGDFYADISPWVVGYLVGREIFPEEVALTNESHPELHDYQGTYMSLNGANPTEIWLAQHLDSLVLFEQEHFGRIRPVGFSSWPTLDPITHPTEQLIGESSEDREQIDMADLVCSESSAGFFMGFHAYPYYPDFIVHDPYYQAESDAEGPNNYLGYLKDLKNHYADIPLVVAEFGVPSSWGSAHMSPSGMHHGGLSEEQEGAYALRMLDNIREAGYAGGIQFSLIDEWFKQTWITNPLSDRTHRHLWHNITAPEQNFGILAYASPPEPFSEMGSWPGQPVEKIKVLADYSFFRIRLYMKTGEYTGDTLWLGLDTYESGLGESVLPDGTSLVSAEGTDRVEFALGIPLGGHEASLMVIPSYDVFGVKKMLRLDTLTSTVNDAGLWNPVRWKTDYYYNRTQYIGRLKISASEDPYEFLSAVTIFNDSLEIRIPWTLINFNAPPVRRVIHYVSRLSGQDIEIQQQDTLSEGIAIGLSFQDELYRSSRYSWAFWDYEKIQNLAPIERKKESFHILKAGLPEYNSLPVGRADSFSLRPGEVLEISLTEGLLRNDFDIDGNVLEAVLSFGDGTSHGNLQLHPDGSFRYEPESGFRGDDFFMYYLDDGRGYSTLIPVFLSVNYPVGLEYSSPGNLSSVYPNPGQEWFRISIPESLDEGRLEAVDLLGRKLFDMKLDGGMNWIELPKCAPGVYLFNLYFGHDFEQHRILIQ